MQDKHKAHGNRPAAIIVINDRVKIDPATQGFFHKYHRLIRHHYASIYATEGTARLLQRYFTASVLGHGPHRGDFNVLKKVIARKDAGQVTHVFFFMDWRLDLHERLKEHLMAMLMQENAVWYPNPATAAAYLEAVKRCPTPAVAPVLAHYAPAMCGEVQLAVTP